MTPLERVEAVASIAAREAAERGATTPIVAATIPASVAIEILACPEPEWIPGEDGEAVASGPTVEELQAAAVAEYNSCLAEASRALALDRLDRQLQAEARAVPDALKPILKALRSLGPCPGVEQVSLELRRLPRLAGTDREVARAALLRELRSLGLRGAHRLIDAALREAAKRVSASPARSCREDGPPLWPEGHEPQLDRSGQIRASAANALLYARHYPGLRGRVRWNERYLRAEWAAPPIWSRPGSQDQAQVIDADAVECCELLQAAEGVAFSPTALYDALIAEARQHAYDPVRDYLDDLRWDGRIRIPTWTEVYLGVDPTPYTSSVGQAWLISAIARTLEPGCQADHLLVLEGPQGARKTSALRALASPWYAELSLDPGSKDSILDVHGPWVVEWAEMSGLNRREAEAVKTFLSRPVDRFRAPYARATEDVPRRCVIAGTTNEDRYLQDPTGGRRYWPIRVGEIDVEQLADDRDQLWAEALAMYRAGRRWWLDEETEATARGEQAERRQHDVWQDRLSDWTACLLRTENFVSTTELLTALDLPAAAQGPGTARRLSAVMAELGWEPTRQIGGSRARGYRKTEVPDEPQ